MAVHQQRVVDVLGDDHRLVRQDFLRLWIFKRIVIIYQKIYCACVEKLTVYLYEKTDVKAPCTAYTSSAYIIYTM